MTTTALDVASSHFPVASPGAGLPADAPRSIEFIPNPVRAFASHTVRTSTPPHHDCSQTLSAFATAVGSGPYADRTFTIHQCTLCHLGLTTPVPSEATSHLLYESRESNDFQPNDSSLVSRLKALATRRDVRSFLRRMPLPDGPLLDFGCGNAAFALGLQEILPARNVFGADLQQTPPNALGPTRYLTYAALDQSPQRYALILCRHVLEHSYDPVAMLTRLSNLLVPGGVLVIEVPSLTAPVGRLFGKYWDGFYVPFHPIHFTRASLRAAVSSVDLDVLAEGGAEMPKMGRSLHNLLGGRYHLGLFALGMLLHPLQVAIGLATRDPACLRIWAQKRVAQN